MSILLRSPNGTRSGRILLRHPGRHSGAVHRGDPWKERILSVPSLLEEPGRVDEPQAADEYAAVLTSVVAAGRPLIVRRNGEDLAAVIPLEHLELLRELQLEHPAHQEVERLAAAVDWTRSGHSGRRKRGRYEPDGPAGADPRVRDRP